MLVLGFLLVGVAYLSAGFSPRHPRTVALDIGLSGIRVTLVLLSLFWVQELLAKEVERKTVLHSLAYPALKSHEIDLTDAYTTDGTLPQFMIKVRDGNDETVHYFQSSKEVDAFKAGNADLFGGDTEMVEKKKDGPTRRAKISDLHLESKATADLLGKLSKKGLAVDHYTAQDKPLFELTEGEGERATVTPLFSIPEIRVG